MSAQHKQHFVQAANLKLCRHSKSQEIEAPKPHETSCVDECDHIFKA